MGYFVYGLHSGDGEIRYVGMSQQPDTRLRQHRSQAREERGNAAVHKWMRKHGVERIEMSILAECDTFEAQCETECKLIEELPNLLNHGSGGIGRPRGAGWSDQERANHERYYREHGSPLLGRSPSEETRKKISAKLSGRPGIKHTDSSRKKISESKMGARNPNWGKQMTPEAKRKQATSRANQDPNKFMGRAKLNWDIVAEIRASSDSLQDLANKFGVSTPTIWRIMNNKTWKV